VDVSVHRTNICKAPTSQLSCKTTYAPFSFLTISLLCNDLVFFWRTLKMRVKPTCPQPWWPSSCCRAVPTCQSKCPFVEPRCACQCPHVLVKKLRISDAGCRAFAFSQRRFKQHLTYLFNHFLICSAAKLIVASSRPIKL
jgi:hypothetical protein